MRRGRGRPRGGEAEARGAVLGAMPVGEDRRGDEAGEDEELGRGGGVAGAAPRGRSDGRGQASRLT